MLAPLIAFLVSATPTPTPTPTPAPRPTAAARNLSEYASSMRGRTPTPGSLSTYRSTVPNPTLAITATPVTHQGDNAPCAVPPDLKERSKRSVLREPVELSRTKPDYSKDLRAKRVQGEVVLMGVICRDGSVAEARVLRSDDRRLEVPALAAFRGWRYKPATVDGEPIPVFVTVVVRFSLH